MEKKINDVLHLYLGCRAVSLDGGTMTYTLSSIDIKGHVMFRDEHGNEIWLSNWKIALRKLDSVTNAEIDIVQPLLRKILHADNGVVQVNACSDYLNTLRKMNFDCDSLIESGLAIDESTIKK